ncbi:ubiquitin conjugating enzyme [Aspergillus bombycis]|uniref:Ubiquitin conjugating enzyme n=1 Tax=Aspergillus bombycis TaxID=109264 RepID=A0A1F7ZRM6_9EURO|nr:ubiquitin conjugating enzyme [Aspergillus bombycis]OGM41768.1 ubiquitin conjugating enzyme [Aspergillus bombycis]
MDVRSGLTSEATKIGVKKDVKFEVDDACCLKSNPTLVGHVCRTDHDADNDEPLNLSTCLILSYTPVPQKDLEEFLETGVPPKGYVFVSFTEPSQGNSLIHQSDLELVDRTLDLGDTVKRHPDDTISGTVISTSATCSLEPIAYRTLDPKTGEYGPLNFTETAIKREGSLAIENDATKPPLLHEIPVVELKKYEEFSEGDYIVYRQKLGIIHGIDRDAILLLPNQSVVSPLDPSALEIPLPFEIESLVALPNNTSAMRHYPLANGGSIWSNESNFRSLNPTARGYVIATPAMDIQVDWLCPNVFAAGTSHSGTNLDVIRASTLRGNAMVCDFGQVPQENPNEKPVYSDTWLSIGDRVRFRNSISAAVKYPAYQHMPTEQTFGYDVNILRVTSKKTKVTVQWQDGTTTTEAATSLHKFFGADDEVWPGNLVVTKDGIEAIREPCKNNTGPFGHHMKETLHVRRVGVVQNVDSQERIASVRWHKDPDIKMTHQGNMLVPGSFLGELSDVVTEVSIYELYSYSSMQRALNDLVLLAPGIVHRSSIPAIGSEPTKAAGPCRLSALSPVTFSETFSYLESMKLSMVNSEWFKRTTEIDTSPVPSRYSVHHEEFNIKLPTDFIGKIVSIDTEGTITIRTAGADNVRDIRVPWERIMMVIDEDNIIPPASLGPFDLFNLTDIDRSVQPADLPFTETIEYEGGERLDNDSGDDDWTTEGESELGDEDFEDVEYDSEDADGLVAPALSIISPPERLDHDEQEQPGTDEARAEVPRVGNRLLILSIAWPSSCPPGFSLLESPAPSDHHFFSRVPSEAPGLRTKRIQKEFEILQSSLPAGIFVRTWESRMDLLRVLIIGPQGTPYEHAPFKRDDQPNLGENGNICLSLLGTWPGKHPTESWSPTSSTVLQILVSIMGLVLVKMPFYNEAGYETLAAEEDRHVESTQYTEKAFLITRTFIQHALENPTAGLEDVLAWHYFAEPRQEQNNAGIRPRLLRRAIDEALGMIEHHNRTTAGEKLSEEHAASAFVSRLSLGAVVMLRKHINTLEKIELAVNSVERV